MQNRSKKELDKAKNAAVRILASRSHTAFELEQKLTKRNFSMGVIRKVLSECERLKYIDDEANSRRYFEELKSKRYGPHRIRSSMIKKGFKKELIDNILFKYNIEKEEIEDCRRAIQKKINAFNREKDIKRKKEKIYRYLFSRGFSGSIITKIIRELDIAGPEG